MVLDLRFSVSAGVAECPCDGVNCNHKCNHQTCRRTDSGVMQRPVTVSV